MAQTIIGNIREFFTTATANAYNSVRSYTRRWRSSFRQSTQNWGRADYEFWRKAYYARVTGLELSGLLLKPIISKLAAWSLGRAPKWKIDNEPSQIALSDWWSDHHPDILRAWRGALLQGDSFAVVNSDLSVTVLPPESVDPIVAEDDFANIIGWRVTELLEHPETTRRMTVIDEYYANQRIHIVEIDGRETKRITYPNLLGRVPLVAISMQPQPGEVFGHPVAEALLPLLHKYGEVLEAAIEGNVLQGRPTPVLSFETVEDLEKFDAENATTESQELPNGTSIRVKTYDVDLSQLLIASGAKFSYESPGSFSTDTAKILEILFYLYGQHSELPEFLLGMAIASSKASAETQLPPFLEYVKMLRGDMAGWMIEIAEIALGYLSLTQPGVNAGGLTLQWEALDQGDGNLTLSSVQWAYVEGLIDELTALQMLPVEIDDAPAVLERAQAEREEKRAQMPETHNAEQSFDADLADQINSLELG